LREAIETKRTEKTKRQSEFENDRFRQKRGYIEFAEQMQKQLEASEIPILFSQLQEYFQDPDVVNEYSLRCKPSLVIGSGKIFIATLNDKESSIKNNLFIRAKIEVDRVILSYGEGFRSSSFGVQHEEKRNSVVIPADSLNLANNVQNKIVDLLLHKDKITWLGHTQRTPHDPYTRGDFDGGG